VASAPVEATPAPRLGVRIVRSVVGLLVGLAVAAGVASFIGVHLADVVRYVTGVSLWAVAGCAASGFVVLAFQSLRWHLVMQPLLGLRYGQAYRAQVVGMMFNAILPARGGDLLRVQYLGRRTGKSRATVLGTEFVDRWLDWFGWIPVLAVLSATTTLPRWLYTALAIFAGLLGTWAVVMVVLSRRGFEPRGETSLAKVYRSFRVGIDAFRARRTLLVALAVAPLPWIWEALVIRYAGHAFGIQLSYGMAFSVLMGFNVAMVVPSPGAIGTVEAGGTAALAFFGVDQSRALAFMFVYHFCQLLPGIAAGVAILVAEGERLFGPARRPGDAPEGTALEAPRGA
jgi:uncharacterized protein (TIRG00374 family)